tara:strand:+ start:371 stop:511 length:141 start_codon:yes stop_codon:yes gene_type:complete
MPKEEKKDNESELSKDELEEVSDEIMNQSGGAFGIGKKKKKKKSGF